jgi:hypothetical protein
MMVYEVLRGMSNEALLSDQITTEVGLLKGTYNEQSWIFSL